MTEKFQLRLVRSFNPYMGARFFYNRFSAPGGKSLPPWHIWSSTRRRNKVPTAIPMLRGPAVQWCCRRYHRKSRYTGNRYGGLPHRRVVNVNRVLVKVTRILNTDARSATVSFAGSTRIRQSHILASLAHS